MGKTRVVHCKKEPYDVYVGRPGPWGNPFSHLPSSVAKYHVATREAAIDAFRAWILQRPELMEKIRKELKGKVLGCWCSPKSCHADVLAEIADS